MNELVSRTLPVSLSIAAAIASVLVPIALVYATYWLVSLPLRRRERARLLLDILELGLADGHTPEQTITRAANTRDKVLGVRFHMLAAHIRAGMPLFDALARVPPLLPPQIVAMLGVGAELGDIRRVLPACRQVLNDALSQTRGALNYLAILAFLIVPVVPVLSTFVSLFIIPKFELIARDLELGLPAFTTAVFAFRGAFVTAQAVVCAVVYGVMLLYIGGPHVRGWAGAKVADRILWLLPWRRKRLQRDVGSMLAMLLDARVPEQRAILLAAQASNSLLLETKARAAADELARGASLTDAIRLLDSSDELHWRFRNAAAGGCFLASLRGWFELLDARAFQQEQAAAQTFTTLLVLWNGAVVGIFVVAMFHMLTNIVEGGVLW